MIYVTHFNGKRLYLNPDLIRSVEETPDTVVTLTDQTKILVRESAEVIAERFINYHRKIGMPIPPESASSAKPAGSGE